MSAQAGMREFRIGAIVGSPVVLAALLYALLTPHGPHRAAILVLIVLSGISVVVVLTPAGRRLVRRGDSNTTMTAWCASFVALATSACILDSGLSSPFVAVFFVSLTYAAVALPTRRVIGLAALDLASLILVGALDDLSAAGIGHIVLWGSALSAAAAIGALVSDDRLRRARALRRSQHEIVHRLALVVESRDNDTGEHVDRMSRYAELIAAELGWEPERCSELRLAAALHDVGKVAVPDAILLKPGRLTDEERRIMQQHCAVGHEMLSGSDSTLLDLAAIIALTHHERWDGQGYPYGRAGEEIPLPGRIVAVADVFDALTSRRVYKPAMDVGEAVEIICRGRGSQFDPAIVDAFLARIDEVSALYSESRATAAAAAAAEDLPSVPLPAAVGV